MKRKRRLNLEEYNAMKTAYGLPFERKEIFITLLKPFMFIFIFTYPLYSYWWTSLIFSFMAAVYQWRRIIPLNLKRDYDTKAFQERNNFINSLTQVLTNPTRTTIDGISKVSRRAKGEFKKDLMTLVLRLRGADPNKVHSAFAEFGKRYENDVVFQQYIDQLESAVIDGRINIETLKDIKSLHNHIAQKREGFIDSKVKESWNYKQIIFILFLANIALYTMGKDQYLQYAHGPIGWVANTLYLFLIFIIFRFHLKKMEDDDVMEVNV